MAIALPMRREHALGGESVSVERILEQRDVRTWFATLLESVRLTPDERTLELATTVFSHLASDKLSGWHLYLARISDRPIGTCALHLGSTAGLYSVGTVPAASGPGALLYRDLGFKDYCRFRECVWRPSPSHQATKPRALDSGR